MHRDIAERFTKFEQNVPHIFSSPKTTIISLSGMNSKEKRLIMLSNRPFGSRIFAMRMAEIKQIGGLQRR